MSHLQFASVPTLLAKVASVPTSQQTASRVTPDVREKMRLVAAMEGCTISHLVEAVFQDFVDRFEMVADVTTRGGAYEEVATSDTTSTLRLSKTLRSRLHEAARLEECLYSTLTESVLNTFLREYQLVSGLDLDSIIASRLNQNAKQAS